MRKTILALFLCFGTFPSFGQVLFSESNDAGYVINGTSPSPFVSVTVADSASSKPLPGATVFVSGGHDADTLKMVLSEVLRDLRKADRCYVKYELRQGCFHITAR